MKKLIDKFTNRLHNIWLGYSDKILHFLFGYLIASIFQTTGYYMVIPAVVIGTLKEYYDITRDNKKLTVGELFNADWACTVAGGFMALFIYGASLFLGVRLPGFITVLNI